MKREVARFDFKAFGQAIKAARKAKGMRNVPPPVFGSVEAVNRFFPQNLGDFFQRRFFLAAEEKGCVAIPDDGVGVFLVDGF